MDRGGGGGILIAFFTTYCLLSMDAASPEDSDLRVVRPEVPEEQNGFFPICEAAEKVRLPDDQDWIDDCLAGKEWNQAKVDALLGDNAEPLALWHQALKRPDFQVPTSTDTLLRPDYIYSWWHVVYLADLNAAALHRQGRDKEAFDEAMRLVAFGRKIMGGQGSYINYLVGIGIEETGLSRLRQMVADARLDGDQLAAYERALAAGIRRRPRLPTPSGPSTRRRRR